MQASQHRFRSMPCQTFVACGNCPYNERCVFLHDSRVRHSKRDGIAARATPQNNSVKDTFYWPDMPVARPATRLDARALPSNNQCYSFPLVGGAVRSRDNGVPGQRPNMHDSGVFSLWNHFVYHFDPNATGNTDSARMNGSNLFTGTKRLDVFVQLSDFSLAVNVDFDTIEVRGKHFRDSSPTSVACKEISFQLYD